MATAKNPTPASAPENVNSTTPTPPPAEDIVQRYLKRTLPCKLDREEMTDIAIVAAKKRRHLRELEEDFDAEKKRRKQQIDELQAEINTHDRELDTGEQERVVLCDLVFRSGLVYTRRRDTAEELEPRPATAQEAQRFLPAVENTLQGGPPPPLLEQAMAAQAAEQAAIDATAAAGDGADGVPAELAADDQEDDGLCDPQQVDEGAGESAEKDPGDGEPYEADGDEPDGDETPAQRSVREAEQGRAARKSGGGGKRGGKRGAKGGAK